MRFRSTIKRSLSWLQTFREADIGFDVESGNIGIIVSGLPKKDGSANPKGNVVAALPPEEAGDLMAVLRAGPQDKSSRTAAEVAADTLTVSDDLVTFKVSDESGSRTVKVPVADWPNFLDDFEAKLEGATELLQVAAEMEAEANAEGSDAE